MLEGYTEHSVAPVGLLATDVALTNFLQLSGKKRIVVRVDNAPAHGGPLMPHGAGAPATPPSSGTLPAARPAPGPVPWAVQPGVVVEPAHAALSPAGTHQPPSEPNQPPLGAVGAAPAGPALPAPQQRADAPERPIPGTLVLPMYAWLGAALVALALLWSRG